MRRQIAVQSAEKTSMGRRLRISVRMLWGASFQTMRQTDPIAEGEAGGGRRGAAAVEGALLRLGGAGTGKSELLARRLADLAAAGTAPERVLVIGARRATARRLRDHCEALLDGPYEELWVGCWDEIGERLVREQAEAAGLDPFFDVLGRAERLGGPLCPFSSPPVGPPPDHRKP